MLTTRNSTTNYFFTYDLAGRTLAITDSMGRVISYTYDNAGRRLTMTADGKTTSYLYDQSGRMTSIGSDIGQFAIGYDSAGRRNNLAYPNKVTTNYAYDIASRLTAITTAKDKTPIDALSYSFDALGRIIQKNETPGNGTITAGYSYDASSRLTGVSPTTTVRGPKSKSIVPESFGYDRTGNRLTSTNGQSAYGSMNQLLSTESTSTDVPDSAYNYDKTGNQILKTEYNGNGDITATREYRYDTENRLIWVRVTKQSKVNELTFTYDSFGRRIAKTVKRLDIPEPDGAYASDEDIKPPYTITYQFDGADIIQSTKSKSRETTQYVREPSIDRPLAQIKYLYDVNSKLKKQTISYYHQDHLGSVTALTDKDGRVIQRYFYSSFGTILRKEHPGANIDQPFTYTGREWDQESGLYFYRARYYDAEAGRFISKDPIGFGGEDMLLYGYTKNNPVDLDDPSGLKSKACCKQDWLECVGKCIDKNDPLNLMEKGIFTGLGGTIPKSWAKLFVRVIQTPGAKTLTTVPSMVSVSLKLGTRKIVRTIGRYASPLWIGYGLYMFGLEATCCGMCANDKCSF